MFPEVAACTGESEDNRQRLESCLQAAWGTIPQEFFDIVAIVMVGADHLTMRPPFGRIS
jgi:hypothetical protein